MNNQQQQQAYIDVLLGKKHAQPQLSEADQFVAKLLEEVRKQRPGFRRAI